jgi:hypothetical protein
VTGSSTFATLGGDASVVPAPAHALELLDHVVGEPEDLGHFADRALGSIGGHRRRKSAPVPAILSVEILHHLFAPLVLEVDINVGRLISLARYKALE